MKFLQKIALVAVLIQSVWSQDTPTKPTAEFCETPECLEIAERVRNNMNASADPCHNFYDFVCGGFKAEAIVPDDDIQVSSFTQLEKKMSENIKLLLEDESLTREQRSFRLPQIHYQACMNEAAIESLGLKPLEDIFAALGGWPLLMGASWDESSFRWHEKILLLRQNGLPMDQFFSLLVSSDIRNNSRLVLGLDPPGFALHHKYLREGQGNSWVKSYYRFMIEIASNVFGGDLGTSAIEMLEVLKFEIDLAIISKPEKEEKNNISSSYQQLTVEELSQLDPATPWLNCINGILGGVKINASQTLVVFSTSYFERLSGLIQSAPPRVLGNYIMWKIALASLKHLNMKARGVAFKYAQSVSGVKAAGSRWSHCVHEVTKTFGIPVGAMYIRRHFNESTMEPIKDLVARMKAMFSMHLLKNDWFDEETRTRALEKAHLMKENIGYSPNLLNDSFIQSFYSGLSLDNGSYFRNFQRHTKFLMDFYFSKLEEKIDKTVNWTSFDSPVIVNAYYSPLQNSINIPAGILQGNFFSSQVPMFWNYGAIGSVIGHEMSHGFDDVGGQFDAKGNLFDWWNPKTKEQFLERTKCLVSEYDAFRNSKSNLTVNGQLTLGENIADNEGIKIAYEAYSSLLKEKYGKEEERLLPGLPGFSRRQLFWMSLGNVWCGKVRPESGFMLFQNVHPPALYRVIGPLRNMEEFSRDFNCTLGSAMNPKHKCTVW